MRRMGAQRDRIEYVRLNRVDGRCCAQEKGGRSWLSRSNPYWMRHFALTVVCGATFPRRTWSSWLTRWSTRPPCQRAAATPRATPPSRTWRARPRFPPCSLAAAPSSLAGATATTSSSTASSTTAPANSTSARATSSCFLPARSRLSTASSIHRWSARSASPRTR